MSCAPCRNGPIGQAARLFEDPFYALCERELIARGLRYVKISGDIDHRVMMSTAAIAELFE